MSLLHAQVQALLTRDPCIWSNVSLPGRITNHWPGKSNPVIARILEICGYGGDGKGFLDYGREIVVIKPLKMVSNQRENKFRNVIEALWGLLQTSKEKIKGVFVTMQTNF